MLEKIRSYYSVRPLRAILIVALLIRMVAVIFSKGYGMHDDHFLTVEPAQAWVDGRFDISDWTRPERAEHMMENPTGISFLYPGALFVVFKVCDSIGFTDPQGKMYLIRLLQALFSLLLVYYGFLIAEKLKDRKTAGKVGWMLALFWILPVASVHNFVEIVCIPALIASSWFLLQYDDDKKIKWLLYSAIWISVAAAIRFQVWFFFGGVGLYFLIRWRLLHGVYYLLFTAIAYFITQLPDLFIWGKPFVLNQNYFEFNMENAEAFINHPFYQYFLIVTLLAIPPFAFFIWAGYFNNIKKTLPVFLPSLLFFLVHSYFPNKQERFILPFLPYLIILGMIGWENIKETKQKWFTNKNLVKYSMIFFWAINIFGLILLTPSYTKRSRVETMTFLRTQENVNGIIFENSHADYEILPPMFYLGSWTKYEIVPKGYPVKHLYDVFGEDYKDFPHYIVFIEDENLEERISNFENEMNRQLEEVTVIEPGYLDKLVFWLNPKNRNFTYFIYRVKEF